jgi:carbon monoxide dehydrogenase subunit G
VKVEGVKEFEAPPQVVWDVLMDPSRLAKLLPGVESFEIQDDKHWTANVKVPLGMGGLKLKFSFEKAEERPIEYAKLNAKGQGVGAIIGMDTEFNLEPVPAGTSMRWVADIHVAGPIGSMGQRVFQPIVNQQVSSVLNALEEQVEEANPDEAKADSAKTDEPKPDEPKPDEPKPDEPKPDEPKPDEPKTDEQEVVSS